MLVLNFTHPITEEQCKQIEQLAQRPIEEVRTIPVQIDQAQSLSKQIQTLVEVVGLTSHEWQTRHILINPPGYAPAAFLLLAELHGRVGHFPTFIRLRPKPGPITQYEVAELLNLQTIREEARRRR